MEKTFSFRNKPGLSWVKIHWINKGTHLSLRKPSHRDRWVEKNQHRKIILSQSDNELTCKILQRCSYMSQLWWKNSKKLGFTELLKQNCGVYIHTNVYICWCNSVYFFLFLGGYIKNLLTITGIRGKSGKESQVKKILLLFYTFLSEFFQLCNVSPFFFNVSRS